MIKAISVFLVFLALFSGGVAALAAPLSGEASVEDVATDSVQDVPVEDAAEPVVTGDQVITDPSQLPPDAQLVDISVYSVVSPVDPADTSGLKSVLLSLIGSYDPIVVEYRYMNQGASYYSYLREVQPDFVWIGALLLFALVIYCLFRLGGVLFGSF